MGLVVSVFHGGLREMARRVRRIRRPNRSDFTEIPPELLQTIATLVGVSSFRDLQRLRSTCRTLNGVVDAPMFYANVDLWVMQTPNLYLNGVADFNLRCLENGNPSAIFIKGTWDFFKNGNLEEGLAGIRVAAERRYDLAKYAYACLIRILNPGVEVTGALVTLDRDSVRAARQKVVASDSQSWEYGLPQWFTEKIDQLDVDGIYKCKCTRNRMWPRAWDERVKKGVMCDSCFWKIHMLGFCHDFPCKVMGWPQ